MLIKTYIIPLLHIETRHGNRDAPWHVSTYGNFIYLCIFEIYVHLHS
jgi:hypothetical protein